jgi:RsiW-degrading membrane proteinase PrsW (M82 family)
MFDHLVYGIKFDCFDLSHMQNDIKRLLFFISQIYVVGLYFLKYMLLANVENWREKKKKTKNCTEVWCGKMFSKKDEIKKESWKFVKFILNGEILLYSF